MHIPLLLPSLGFPPTDENLHDNVAYLLVPQVDVRFDFLSLCKHCGATLVESRLNILPSLRPCAITRPTSSMKHPRCVNRTSIPWSTICPTDTKFFVIVGTCNTFISFPFCPTWLRGTFPMSSPVATTPGCVGFSRYENHSLWLVMWFDAPESTYHT